MTSESSVAASASSSLDASNNNVDDVHPQLSTMFINSTDTLRHREIHQKIPPAWNDRPPLFFASMKTPSSRGRQYYSWRQLIIPQQQQQQQQDLVPSSTTEQEEDPNLLKGMIRKGIPSPLRCAVWMSNIVQSTHQDQDLKVSHAFRTLGKVRLVDGLYHSLWWENNTNNEQQQQHCEAASTNGAGGILTRTIRKEDVKRMEFGNTDIWNRLEEEQCPGRKELERVLYALYHCVVGGIADYAPLLPSLATVLLSFMSESYTFYACREMCLYSMWYFPTSRTEHKAMQRAFCDVLQRLHPSTYATMEEQDATSQYTQAIFQDFFITILPEWMVFRLMDMYSLEGSKVLFRFGVALAVLYGKEYKDRYMYASTEWNKYWLGLFDYCHSGDEGGLNFEFLVKKAYGVHGNGVRKRFRFPRRSILARIIEMEEEAYRKQQQKLAAESGANSADGTGETTPGLDSTDFYLHHVEPLGLVIPPPPEDPMHERVVARLAESKEVRTKLAEWLPLSLRFTKLDLVYSTSYHGRTLESFYRHVSKSPHTILILEPYNLLSEQERILIGMYASQTWHPSSRVYGDGRCFLFRIVLDGTTDGSEEKECLKHESNEKEQKENDHPQSQCWKWRPPDLLEFGSVTSEDLDPFSAVIDGSPRTDPSQMAVLESFQISTNDFLSMGGNDQGGSGLRLNEDLTKAESTTAAGFDNEPLLPGAGGMFEVGLLEVYQLVRQMDGIPVR